jgi:cytochrome c2
MSKRLGFKLALAGVALLALAASALAVFAGGWAVATLDTLPDSAVAGEPLEVGFMIRQHGQTPWNYDNVKVVARREEGGDSFTVVARPEGAEGHYTASLNFPTSGTWRWGIETGLYPERQPMPPLVVLASNSASATTTAPQPASPLPMLIGWIGLIGMAGGVIALARTRAPWAAALLLVAVLVSGVGFVSAANRGNEVAVSAGNENVAPQNAPTLTREQLGQQLFVAKGCVVCHTHEAVMDVNREIDFYFEESPNLSDFTADPDYLAKWLDDPKSIKPKTYMPRLGLSEGEIGALVAFINAP